MVIYKTHNMDDFQKQNLEREARHKKSTLYDFIYSLASTNESMLLEVGIKGVGLTWRETMRGESY